MDETAKVAFEAAKAMSGKAIGGLENVTWDKLPASVKQYIKAHPKLTAAQLVLLFVPGLVLTPVLGAIGFTAFGPAAGSAAASFQSANGATAVFSFLQSAAMNGAPAAGVLSGAVTGVSAAAAGAVEWFKWCGNGVPRPKL